MPMFKRSSDPNVQVGLRINNYLRKIFLKKWISNHVHQNLRVWWKLVKYTPSQNMTNEFKSPA